MGLMYSLGNFLLSEWLWGLTWGSTFIPINMVILLLLLRVVVKVPIIPAVLFSVLANIASFLMYTLLVHGGFSWLLGMNFDVTSTPPLKADSLFSICFSLGVIYSALQVALFSVGRTLVPFNFKHILLAVLLSNFFSALLVQSIIKIS